ncbi:hypothetical protein FOMG_19636 [Fusarium oxysporum f. sp. melonis 26406]|uniref:Uncharacterized protein n=1 Tax=Fusarium oxysporum f. sp. melonis 26406 TaxID=1089452 RepID=W9Z5S5_FUSOX|nr:hypothetical protein FOMG_19636 [Fusarium oxysporum f. sp. melonis 26406]
MVGVYQNIQSLVLNLSLEGKLRQVQQWLQQMLFHLARMSLRSQRITTWEQQRQWKRISRISQMLQ